ncbi:putative RNA-dependent RNA polymerase [Imjin River virus 1]|uniref:RNA-directed RNA polymerase n=1 Tax=Imjin River virus 1 TaxID=1758883 RepID=A0A0S2RRG3_9VIRU|nr:putative RNA-dependent RNA polymerase [Imjin River virus 1]ALP32028.1 putative RNA-dependent RNA polymerase [Imjin River virus 1]
MNISQRQVSYDVPSSLVYDRKFDTAIRQSQIDGFFSRLEEPERLNKDDKILLGNIKEEDIIRSPTPHLYAEILIRILETSEAGVINKSSNNVDIKKMMDLSEKVLSIQLQYIMEGVDPSIKKNHVHKLLTKLREQDVDPLVANLLNAAHCVSIMIEDSYVINKYKLDNTEDASEILRSCKSSLLEYLDYTVNWSRKLCAFTKDGHTYIMPKSYMLLIHNKLCDLSSVIIMSQIQAGSAMPSTIKETVVDFCKVMCSYAQLYKNKFFEITKALESLVTGETLRKVEKWKNDEFLKLVCEELLEATGFDYMSSELCYILRSNPIEVISELSCLSKLFGHPLVNMEGGAKAIHKKATESYKLDYRKIVECICYIKEAYIQQYITRYKKWPPHVITSKLAPLPLRMAALYGEYYNSPAITQRFGEAKIMDFVFVDLKPDLKFSKLENAIPYLKDKTLSLLRSKVISMYINQEEDMRTRWADTRLLLVYLLHPTSALDHVNYIEQYCESSTLDELMNYLVIRIVPKEKEHKIDFRGFGCKTYEDRLRCLAQEKAVMQYLDLYSDEQAMTLSELQIARKLEGFRRMKDAFPGYVTITVNLDASSWCNHFRPETVDDAMAPTLDKIYGTNIFSKTHLAYNKTLYYVPDESGTYYWHGQDGGIEGLNQDTWVVVYISQIKTAFSGMSIRYTVLCKGDDCRVVLSIPYREIENGDVAGFKNKIVQRLSETASSLGHKIKILDSYGSETYFNFSKTASVGYIELPQTFRKIQKCYGANNAFIPTMDEYIASTFSNAHSASKVGMSPVSCYYTAVTWSAYYLATNSLYKDLSLDAHTALMLVPSIFGGFPIIYYHNFFVRAESDLMSPFIGLLQFCRNFYPSVHDEMTKFCNISSPPSTTCEGLCRDMYSVPISRPPLPSTVLRNMVADALPRITRNQGIRDLLEAAKSDESDTVMEILTSASHYEAKVLSVIYACLPVSLVSELVRKFESARSVNEMLILRFGKKSTFHRLRRIVRSEKNLQEWRVRTLSSGPQGDVVSILRFCYNTCPGQAAYNIREYAYGKPVTGITMPPLQHQIYITNQDASSHVDWAYKNHYQLTISEPTETLDKRSPDHFKAGVIRPFVGHITSDKSMMPRLYLVEKDFLLNRVQKLIDIVTWTDSTYVDDQGDPITSDIRELVTRILQLYTDMPLEKLSPFSRNKIRGSIQHHVRAANYRTSIVPNVLGNMYRRVVWKTHMHTTLATTRKHLRFNVLHQMCYAVSVLSIPLDYQRNVNLTGEYWIVTSNCEFCSGHINEKPILFKRKNFRSIRFESLQVTMLDQNSKRILRESLAVADNERYMKEAFNREIPNDVALQAAMYVFAMNELKATNNLIAKHGFENATHKGIENLKSMTSNHSKVIDKHYLSKIPTKALLVPVVTIVATMIASMYPSFEEDELVGLLMTEQPTRLPWFFLLKELYEAQQLGPMMNCLSDALKVPTSLNYHTAEGVACLFGSFCYEIWSTRVIPIPLIIISDYQYIASLMNIKIYITDMVRRQIEEGLRHVTSGMLSVFEQKEALAICVGYGLLKTHDISRYQVKESCEGSSDWIVSDLFIDDISSSFDPYSQDANDLRIEASSFIRRIKRLSKLSWTELYQAFLDNYDTVVDTISGFLDREVKVYNISIAECTSTVLEFEEQDARLPTRPDARDGNLHYTITTAMKNTGTNHVKLPTFNYLSEEKHDFHTPTVPQEQGLYQPSGYATCQPVGYCNASASTLSEIILYMNFKPPDVLKNLNIVCLADGVGSFTSWFALNSTGCNILFNSLPESDQVQLPYAAMTEAGGNTIVTNHMYQGVYDLKHVSTIDKYMDLIGVCHILTCDIDIMESDDTLAERIWVNVVRGCLKLLSANGLFICKVRFCTTELSQRFMSTIRSIFMDTYLIRPHSVSAPDTLYIIGQNPIRQAPIPKLLAAYKDIYHRTMQALGTRSVYPNTQDFNQQIRLEFPISYNWMWMKQMTPMWVSKLEQLTKMSVGYVALNNLLKLADIKGSRIEVYREFLRIYSIKDQADKIVDQLDKQLTVNDINGSSHLADLRSSRGRLVCRSFVFAGMFNAPSHLLNGSYTVARLINSFCAHVRRFKVRDLPPELTANRHILYSQHGQLADGFRLPIWNAYCNGFSIFLWFLAWLEAYKSAM